MPFFQNLDDSPIVFLRFSVVQKLGEIIDDYFAFQSFKVEPPARRRQVRGHQLSRHLALRFDNVEAQSVIVKVDNALGVPIRVF